ncbi:23188_t:CDS:2, partial [Gigaspora rosea]
AQDIIDLTVNTDIRQLTQGYLDNNDFVTTEEIMDNNRIIEFIINPNVDNKVNNAVEEEPRISFTEAKQNLNLLLKFVRQQSLQPDGFIKKNDEAFFRDFILRTHRAFAKTTKQGILENF